ncbi:hypothetical protein D9757_012714 [Collybiopsis confluens]|uniref:Integral membrane protein n=1 Tax=Collybiopsis confluens TaxID=2823264 RepID=A0A8H5HFK9_9AGAR|nr:hypothetical protein D9757_012714 [Collybiopsis confluens]
MWSFRAVTGRAMTLSSADDGSHRWHFDLHPSLVAYSPANPFSSRSDSHLGIVTGPFLHPTRLVISKKEELEEDPQHAGQSSQVVWKSRNHRKNRHVDRDKRHPGGSALVGIAHMGRIEYWNISWAVAIAFTLGSIVWVINGFYSFLPFVDESFAMSVSGIGWTAWLGATVFEFGAILGVLEAWNRGDTVNFGRKVKRAFESSSETDAERKKWIWFSMDLKYWHELGFLAAFVQLWAATIFWISGFTALPEIQNTISSETGILDGVFWTPQVVGGMGFIISSSLLMLETQTKWYLPNPLNLGWQIAVWNLIGAVGFMLCGALGYAAQVSAKAAYQSSLCTFWGGWAFLLGSILQWYESVNSV